MAISKYILKPSPEAELQSMHFQGPFISFVVIQMHAYIHGPPLMPYDHFIDW